MNVLFTDDPTAEDKIKEDCVPGSPHITFYYQSGVEIELVNPQPGSGYFSSKIAVLEGDDTLKIARRLAKLWKQIKGQSFFFSLSFVFKVIKLSQTEYRNCFIF